MEKINSLTGMTDLIETKIGENELANKVFQIEKILKGEQIGRIRVLYD